VPYGPRGLGLVSLTADGRMMAVLVDGRPSLPEGAKREYSSYCGNYTFDGSMLTTIVDASSDPARMGTAQVREVRFEGDKMILMPPPTEGEWREGDEGAHLGACQLRLALELPMDYVVHVLHYVVHVIFQAARDQNRLKSKA